MSKDTYGGRVMEIFTSSPDKAGWYWWKATTDSNPIEINVHPLDIEKKKYNRFGGEWYKFPTFSEISDHRRKSSQVDFIIAENNRKVEKHVEILKKFVDFLLSMSDKTFVPKKDIKAFLEEVRKIS